MLKSRNEPYAKPDDPVIEIRSVHELGKQDIVISQNVLLIY